MIAAPAADERTPSLNIACGEKPVVECDDPAKAAPQNLGAVPIAALTPAVTLVANVVHLVQDKMGHQGTRYDVRLTL